MRLDLAHALRDSGLPWEPARGDRFVVPGRDMDDEVFVVSDLTVEVHDLPTGTVVGFNGTTEWALDSLTLDEVLWLPREDQLRELLGARFRRLEARGDLWVVVLTGRDGEREVAGTSAVDAYAGALLGVRSGA